MPVKTSAEDAAPASGQGEAESGFTRKLGDLLLSLTRASDAVARMAESEFVVLAPGTDREGADRLIERVIEKLSGDGPAEISLQAGICAVSGDEPDSPAAEEFLSRATNALREVQTRESWGRWDPTRDLDPN